jgi:hypothetical protein
MPTPIVQARLIVDRILRGPSGRRGDPDGLRERRTTPCPGHFEISGERAIFRDRAKSFAAGTAGRL